MRHWPMKRWLFLTLLGFGLVYSFRSADAVGFLLPPPVLEPRWIDEQLCGWGAPYSHDRMQQLYDAQDNVVVSSTCKREETGWDFLTIKYQPTGEVIWTSWFTGPTADDSAQWPTALGQDGLGNAYVAGGSDEDNAIVRYDGDGQETRLTIFDGPRHGFDGDPLLVVEPDGGFVLSTGVFLEQVPLDVHYHAGTAKYDADGVQLWYTEFESMTLHGTYGGRVVDLAVDDQDNAYILASNGDGDNALIKYSPDGDEIWQAGLGAPPAAPIRFFLGGDGHPLIIANQDWSTSMAVIIARYDPDTGELESTQLFQHAAGAGTDMETAGIDGDGHLLVEGCYYVQGQRTGQYLAKFGSDGAQLWLTYMPNAGLCSDFVWKRIGFDEQDGIALAGHMSCPIDSRLDRDSLLTARFDADGELLWVTSHSETESCSAYSVSVGADGAVDVAAICGQTRVVLSYGCDCVIEGTCWPQGASRPDEPCLVCDPTQSTSAWTVLDGVSCDDLLFCTGEDVCNAGTCEHTGDPCVAPEICDESLDQCISADDDSADDDAADDDTSVDDDTTADDDADDDLDDDIDDDADDDVDDDIDDDADDDVDDDIDDDVDDDVDDDLDDDLDDDASQDDDQTDDDTTPHHGDDDNDDSGHGCF